MFCELHAGTILAALKFSSNMPWDIDGDVHVQPENFTSYAKIAFPKLEAQGYSVVSSLSFTF